MISRIGELFPKRGPGDFAAFSLIELLWAVVLFSLGIVGIFQAYSGMLNASDGIRQRIEAALWLKEKFAAIELEVLRADGNFPPPATSTITLDGTSWQWSWEIGPELDRGLREATLEVERTGGGRLAAATYLREEDERR